MFVFPVLLSLLALWVWDHGGSTRSPLGWANLTKLIGVLEGLDQSNELIDVSADWQVTNGHVSEDTLVVDDVGGSESNTLVLDEAAVRLGDVSSGVSEHGDGHWTEATLFAVLLGVLLMSEVGVSRASDDLAAKLLKFSSLVRELANLSWADESEIERPEEE